MDLVARREDGELRLYALKRLLPSLREDDKARRMFLDEAAVATSLQHPNVAAGLEVGEDQQGPFLLMELVHGVSLAKLLGRSAGDLMPVEVALEIARQTAAGLSAAHEAGVVHRDVSPANILLGFDGVVRLVDFGIAKGSDSSTHTTTNVLKGKLGYLAPEQLRFEPADVRTDLYALGVCLHESLLGERLYGGDSASIARAITAEPPPDVCERRRDVPAEVSELLFDLLAKDRDGRPPSASGLLDQMAVLTPSSPDDLAAHLAAVVPEELDHRGRWEEDAARIAAETTGPVVPVSVPPRGPRPLWVALVAGAAVLAMGIGFVAFRETAPPTEAPMAGPPLVAPTETEPAPAAEGPPEPATEVDALPAEAEAPEPESAEPVGEAAAEPARVLRPRRRRATMRAGAMAVMNERGIDTWSWDE